MLLQHFSIHLAERRVQGAAQYFFPRKCYFFKKNISVFNYNIGNKIGITYT